MPPKTKNPASFVKLSSQNSPNEQNKPRKQVKEKHTVATSPEQDTTKDDSIAGNNESNVRRLPSIYIHEKRFDLLIDGVPYVVHTIPFLWNDTICFRIHINGNEEHLFSWDEEAGNLRAIDENASILPHGIESALTAELKIR